MPSIPCKIIQVSSSQLWASKRRGEERREKRGKGEEREMEIGGRWG
jgi:hypothetical protein